MKKYLLFVVPLLLWGCEKTFDTVIDTSTDNYQVSTIAGIKDTVDLKVPGDSLLNVRLIFTAGSEVSKAYFDIYASDNSMLNSTPVYLQEISTNVFENSFILQRENPIGNYTIRFFASGNSENTKQVALRTFYFNNGQDNVAPVISNSIIEPDTVVVNDTTVIFCSVEASDSNGAIDISEVYFKVYKPDGTTNNSKVLLFDDGNVPEHGDLIAGDGVYSRLIQVNQSNQKGTYRFEFQAKDRSGALSNIINHSVLIQ